MTNWCRGARWEQRSGSYSAPLRTKRRKALLRASSSSSRGIFPCLVLQEGVAQNRRDVGWVGGLQHGSIFNLKTVVNVASYKHRKLKCAVTGRGRLERRKNRVCPLGRERRGQGLAWFIGKHARAGTAF